MGGIGVGWGGGPWWAVAGLVMPHWVQSQGDHAWPAAGLCNSAVYLAARGPTTGGEGRHNQPLQCSAACMACAASLGMLPTHQARGCTARP